MLMAVLRPGEGKGAWRHVELIPAQFSDEETDGVSDRVGLLRAQSVRGALGICTHIFFISKLVPDPSPSFHLAP